MSEPWEKFRCDECHWLDRAEYSEGDAGECLAPLPYWVEDDHKPGRVVELSKRRWCAAWKRPEED